MTVVWINEEYFPMNDFVCPPDEAEVYSGEIFRFGLGNSIHEKDFLPLTSEERFRLKNQNNYKLLCQGSGLSSYKTFEDSKVNYDRITKNAPGLKKKFKSICKIEIDVEDGLVMNTPSKNTLNHVTWWGYKNKVNAYIEKSQIVEVF